MQQEPAKHLRQKEALTELTAQVSVLNQIIKKQAQEIEQNKQLVADLKLNLKKAKLEAQDGEIMLDQKAQQFEDMMQAQRQDFDEQFSQVNAKYKALKTKFVDLNQRYVQLQDQINSTKNYNTEELDRQIALVKDQRAKTKQVQEELEAQSRRHQKQLSIEQQKAVEIEAQLKLQINQRDAEIRQLELQKAEIKRDLQQYASDLQAGFERQIVEKQAQFDLLQERMQQEARNAENALQEGYTRLRTESLFTTEGMQRQLQAKTEQIRELQSEAQRDKLNFQDQLRLFKEQITTLQSQLQIQQNSRPVKSTFDSLAIAMQNENADLNKAVQMLTQQLQAQQMQLQSVQQEYGLQIQQVEEDLKLKMGQETKQLAEECQKLRFECQMFDRQTQQLNQQLAETQERLRLEQNAATSRARAVEQRLLAESDSKLAQQRAEFEQILAKTKNEQQRIRNEFEAKANNVASQSEIATQQAQQLRQQAKQQLVEAKMQADEALSQVRQHYEARLSDSERATVALQKRIQELLEGDSQLRQQLHEQQEQLNGHIDQLQRKFQQERDAIQKHSEDEINQSRQAFKRREEELRALYEDLKAKMSDAQADAQGAALLLRRENEALQTRILAHENTARQMEVKSKDVERRLNDRIAELERLLSEAESAAQQRIIQAADGQKVQISSLTANFNDVEEAGRRKYQQLITQLQHDNKELNELISQLGRDNSNLQAEKQQLLTQLRFEKEQEVSRLRGDNTRLARQLEALERASKREFAASKARVSEVIERSRLQSSMVASRLERSQLNLSQTALGYQQSTFDAVELKHDNQELIVKVDELQQEITRLTADLQTAQEVQKQCQANAEGMLQRSEQSFAAQQEQWECERQEMLLKAHESELAAQRQAERIDQLQRELSDAVGRFQEQAKCQAADALQQRETKDQAQQAALEKLIEEFYTNQQATVKQTNALRRDYEEQMARHNSAYEHQIALHAQEAQVLSARLNAKDLECAEKAAHIKELEAQLQQNQVEAERAQRQTAIQLSQLEKQFMDARGGLEASCNERISQMQEQFNRALADKLSECSALQERQQKSTNLQRFKLEKQLQQQKEELVALREQLQQRGSNAFNGEIEYMQKLQAQRIKTQKMHHQLLQQVIGLKKLLSDLQYVKNEVLALKCVRGIRMPENALIASAVLHTVRNTMRAKSFSAEDSHASAQNDLQRIQMQALKDAQISDALGFIEQQNRLVKALNEHVAAQEEDLASLHKAYAMLEFKLQQMQEQNSKATITTLSSLNKIRQCAEGLSSVSGAANVQTAVLQENWLARTLPAEQRADQLVQSMQDQRAAGIVQLAPSGCSFCANLNSVIKDAASGQLEALENAKSFVRSDEQLCALVGLRELLASKAVVKAEVCNPETIFQILERAQRLLHEVSAQPEFVRSDLKLALEECKESNYRLQNETQSYVQAYMKAQTHEKPRAGNGPNANDVLQLCDQTAQRLRNIELLLNEKQCACEKCAQTALAVAETELRDVFRLAEQCQ